MDSVKIIKDIFDFLKTNGESILDEHYREFTNCISMVSKFKNTTYMESSHGHHYSNCCWSSNLCEEGPDTCSCYIMERRLIKIKKLMLLYNRLQ